MTFVEQFDSLALSLPRIQELGFSQSISSHKIKWPLALIFQNLSNSITFCLISEFKSLIGFYANYYVP